jgi:hypothetical protein
MTTFAVTLERITDVWTHTNADRLAMAKVASMSYQFVFAKGSFATVDLVVYFPIDSVLPEPVISALGLTDIPLKDWLNGQSIAEASNGPSRITPTLLREGIVIRPMREMREEMIGRLIIKQRSPQYLATSDFWHGCRRSGGAND